MGFEIQATSRFQKELKALAKRYTSIKKDLAALIASLSENPTQGILIRPYCYKIRMTIQSKRKGKSSGARVITYVLVEENTVHLLTIYDKADQVAISDAELSEILENFTE